MKTRYLARLLILILMFMYFLLPKNTVNATACSFPTNDNAIIASTCDLGAGTGAVDGVDVGTGITNTGTITINEGATLTVGNGDTQTLAYGSITNNGTIVIAKGVGAQLKKGPIWVTDADGDGYAGSATPTLEASATQPSGKTRRSSLVTVPIPGAQVTFNINGTEKTGTIQTYLVSDTGTYTIEAWGAHGGNNYGSRIGGKGAYIKGDFSLTAGQSIGILVGQKATAGVTSTRGAGGGGGSFVYNTSTSTLLMAAGGGGGAGSYAITAQADGQSGTSGTAGLVTTMGAGGTGGGGGGGGQASGGGAGWNSNGEDAYSQTSVTGGETYLNGGLGGVKYTYGTDGGFGGGGGSRSGSGGGGGYSGGGGGGWSNSGQGGGGGSYNGGTTQTNTAGDNTGNGKVVITQNTNSYSYVADCNDNDTNVYQLQTVSKDADNDGYGEAALISTCIGDISGGAYRGTDGLYNWYTSRTDYADCAPADNTRWQDLPGYVDADRDGLGAGSSSQICSGSSLLLAGYSSNNTDCNDSNASILGPHTANTVRNGWVCNGACNMTQNLYTNTECTDNYYASNTANTACSPTYTTGTAYDTQCYGACTQGARKYGSNTCTAGSGLVWGTISANTACSPTYPANTAYDTQCYGACTQIARKYGSNTCTAGSGLVWGSITANNGCSPSHTAEQLRTPWFCNGVCNQTQYIYTNTECADTFYAMNASEGAIGWGCGCWIASAGGSNMTGKKVYYKNTGGMATWDAAGAACTSQYGRLPTLGEATDVCTYKAAYGTLGSYIWASTVWETDATMAWHVLSSTCGGSGSSKSYAGTNVRCVKD